jgi:hypothetical protein
MKMKEQLQKLITLQEHYKSRADFQWNRGNKDAAAMFDSLANDLNDAVLDLMVAVQEASVNAALVA